MTTNPTAWTADELTRLGRSTELRVASYRPDGTLRPYTIIWVARYDDGIYVRSAHGPDNGWFRRAGRSGHGRIQISGLERDVVFLTPEDDVHAGLDAALHAKYDRYGPSSVGAITGPHAHPSTLQLVPSAV